ncbi:MAG: NUDIX hydrolase [Candidatus Nanoarchaeia archaeon]
MEIIKHFVSTVFIVQDGKVLMTWNKKVSNYVPIGGHVDENELPCDAAIREAKEESGLDIELVSPFDKSVSSNLVQPVNVHLDHVKEDHKHVNLIYFGIVKGGECFKIDDEGKELRWFTKEELDKENVFPHTKEWAIAALSNLEDK